MIPAERPWIDKAESVARVKELAAFLHDWERREMPERRYKAPLRAAKCAGLETALRLGADWGL
ncbi:MAG: hypothetical protein LBP79_00625 [Clostridiales bacterium]|nr:hypothetical protein [Clostridiales bacterium]